MVMLSCHVRFGTLVSIAVYWPVYFVQASLHQLATSHLAAGKATAIKMSLRVDNQPQPLERTARPAGTGSWQPPKPAITKTRGGDRERERASLVQSEPIHTK